MALPKHRTCTGPPVTEGKGISFLSMQEISSEKDMLMSGEGGLGYKIIEFYFRSFVYITVGSIR